MSRTAVCAAVRTACASMTGVVSCTVGRPLKEQIAEAAVPWVIIGAPQPKWTPLTYAANGNGLLTATYPVNIVVVMGRSDMAPSDAEAAREVWADRVRAALSPDPSLGGLVRESELTDGIDNVDTYTKAGQAMQPQAAYRLMVTEDVKRNAIAS